MKYSRFIVASDIHGSHQDPESNRVLFKFIKDFKPDIRILAGDLWDFAPLRKKASEDEKRESMVDDYRAGIEWLHKFKPHHFLRGNHDERLWELAATGNGVLADYALSGVSEIHTIIRKMNCRLYPYHKRDGVMRLGSLKILHGFHCGINAARQTGLIYGACLFGHVHTIDEHSIPGLERRVARSIGCLCSTDLSYASRNPNTLRQANGWAYGVIAENGQYHTAQAEQIGGKWLIPSDFKEY